MILATCMTLTEPSMSRATTYIYTPANSTTDQWSLGMNWSSPPVGSRSTTLIFVGNNATVLGNNLANTDTDDLSGSFVLNGMQLQGTGPASGAATIRINSASESDYLNFISNGSTGPTIQLNAKVGAAGLIYYVSPNISLSNDISFQGNGTASFNFTGVISGSDGLIRTAPVH